MTNPLQQPRQPLIAILALALIEFACSLDWMALSAIGGALMRELALSPASYAVLVSTGSVVAGASGFLVASFIDRFERRAVTECMVVGLLVVSLLTTMVSNYWILLTLRALAGLFGATAASQAYAMVTDLFEPRKQARAYALVIGGFSASLGLGIPTLVFIESHYGWHSIYYVIATLLGITLVLVRLHIPKLAAHPGPAPWQQLTTMLRHRPHYLGLLMMSIVMGTGWILIPFIAPYFTYTLHKSPGEIALFYLYAGAAVITTNFLMSFLVDKWGVRRVVFGVIAVALPLQWLLTHLNSATASYAILIAACFYACSVARWSLCNQLMTSHIRPGMSGGMMSLSFALQECAGGVFVTAGGTLLSMHDGQMTGYDRLGLISFAFNGLLIYFILLLSDDKAARPVIAPE